MRRDLAEATTGWSHEPCTLTTDLERLAAVLARAERLAKGRDAAADDAALAGFGEVDPVDWSVAAVKALTRKRKA